MKQQSSGPPTDEQGCAQLPSLRVHDDGVVEIPDDGVSRPGDWNQAEDCADYEEHARCNDDFGFGCPILQAVGAFSSSEGQQDTHYIHQDGNDDQCAGGLQVPWESQHGIVDLALHLSSALHHAVHPQTFPEDLRRDYVVTNKCSHFPHR